MVKYLKIAIFLQGQFSMKLHSRGGPPEALKATINITSPFRTDMQGHYQGLTVRTESGGLGIGGACRRAYDLGGRALSRKGVKGARRG